MCTQVCVVLAWVLVCMGRWHVGRAAGERAARQAGGWWANGWASGWAGKDERGKLIWPVPFVFHQVIEKTVASALERPMLSQVAIRVQRALCLFGKLHELVEKVKGSRALCPFKRSAGVVMPV